MRQNSRYLGTNVVFIVIVFLIVSEMNIFKKFGFAEILIFVILADVGFNIVWSWVYKDKDK